MRYNDEKEFNWGGDIFRINITPNWQYKLCSIEVGQSSPGKIKFTLAIPNVIFLYMRLRTFLPLKKKRQLKLSYHGRAFWWTLWKDDDEYHGRGFRQGSFHWDDFFLGKSKCRRELIEKKAVPIPMPEGNYDGIAKLVLYSWERPRWFTKKMMRCEIEVPAGIPFEGKGENSWDCGVDATFGMTTGECNSIAQGVGQLVGSVLRDRVKNGGYRDWRWNKPRL